MTFLDLLLVGVTLLLSCFAFVLLFGAPYLPTMNKQVGIALDMLDLQPGQHLLELGSGDGRMLLAAAKRGYEVTGYELNPLLVMLSRFRLRNYKQARVIWGNYWHASWEPAQAIFYFGLQKYMAKLDKKITQEYGHPVKLVSYAFTLPNKRPITSTGAMFLYMYR